MKAKILLLTIIFGIQSVLQFLNGSLALINGGSYGEYGNAFVQAGIMAYLAYGVFTTRRRWTYWLAAVFVGLSMIRFAIGGGLIVFSGLAPSTAEIILLICLGVTFGILPLVLLFDKEVRATYLTK